MPKIKRLAADTWFSKCVREAAGWQCDRCGAQHEENSMGLHNAHYMTRGNWGTRFDPDNVAALCYGCHSYLDSRPYEKAKWFEDKLGKGLAEIVQEKAKRPAYGIKKQLKDITKLYKAEHERIRKERSEGHTGKLKVISYC